MGHYYFCACFICCMSEEDRIAVEINNEIKRILAEQKKKQRKEIKVLLLGTGESGKTTLKKQMKIIHGSGFSEDERCSYTKLVFQNILQAMQEITDAMKTFNIPYSNPQNEIYAQRFQDLDIRQITELQRSYVEAIHHLWADQGFMDCSKHKSVYQLDSTKYFIDNLDRIAAEDYIPTHQDILRVRFPTTGINECCFSIQETTIRIVEVGGPRGKRSEWIDFFDNLKSIIYVASLSGYDQVLREDNTTNRMKESLSLFHTIIHSKWFANTSIILLLNKMDILAEKIQFSDLKTYFPEFEGKRGDVHDAMLFIRSLYGQKIVSNEKKNSKRVYCHFICATDTKESRKLFIDIKDQIITGDQKEYQML